jgi:hypothetical protein
MRTITLNKGHVLASVIIGFSVLMVYLMAVSQTSLNQLRLYRREIALEKQSILDLNALGKAKYLISSKKGYKSFTLKQSFGKVNTRLNQRSDGNWTIENKIHLNHSSLVKDRITFHSVKPRESR